MIIRIYSYRHNFIIFIIDKYVLIVLLYFKVVFPPIKENLNASKY